MTKPAGLTAFILLSLVLLSSTDAAQTVLSFSDQNESASTPDFFRQQGEFAENTELNFERERESERERIETCLLYTSPSPRDKRQSRMPSSA